MNSAELLRYRFLTCFVFLCRHMEYLRWSDPEFNVYTGCPINTLRTGDADLRF